MSETADAFNKLSESFGKLGISAEIAAQAFMCIVSCVPSTLSLPSKRVIHLSRFAKKYRVRKKNINRRYR